MQWIYDVYGSDVRYSLGLKGSKNLLCFGINPSTATPENLDNTIRRMINLSKSNGYNGWIMLNIYPQRATDPNNLHKELDTEIHRINIDYIKQYLSYDCDIVAAWGELINKRPFLKECLKDIYEQIPSKSWLCFGQTKKGHPRHPLYLKNNTSLVPFDIHAYLKYR